jgi:hypothetical protein
MSSKCEVVFSSIQFRDFCTAANVSLPQLKYCLVVAIWAREASIAIEQGYISDPNIPDLSRLLKAVLAKYVETFGVFKLAARCEIAPWFADRETLPNRAFFQIKKKAKKYTREQNLLLTYYLFYIHNQHHYL